MCLRTSIIQNMEICMLGSVVSVLVGIVTLVVIFIQRIGTWKMVQVTSDSTSDNRPDNDGGHVDDNKNIKESEDSRPTKSGDVHRYHKNKSDYAVRDNRNIAKNETMEITEKNVYLDDNRNTILAINANATCEVCQDQCHDNGCRNYRSPNRAAAVEIERTREKNRSTAPTDAPDITERSPHGTINSELTAQPVEDKPLPFGTQCSSLHCASETEPLKPIAQPIGVVPLSVNYHFTRQCNYKCGFCFHTAKTSFVLPLDEAKKGLAMLKGAGMQKVNFSGGEPFIVQRGRFVGELVKYCKETLQLPSVSVVSNGSLVAESWFEKYGEYLDILAVSCDSFDPDTNELIGRHNGKKSHLAGLRTVRHLCTQYKVAFKLNTVVNTHNQDEDMTSEITELDPCRWKVFQCLLIDGENAGTEAIRNASTFVISDHQFDQFLQRHKSVKTLVPESNIKMQNSYLILDEYMRFLDCTQGAKQPSKSVLDVGVQNALKFSGFDEKMFFKRGGKYTWSKEDMKLEW